MERQEITIPGTKKYLNYKEQMVRLKKAMAAQFYLEAIFIEYAVMEDRLESIAVCSIPKGTIKSNRNWAVSMS